ncbi:MAG: 23S rRNA (adenine(2030)-N(6))-methyltransferase RlmJ [Zoogloeaceae bacterium]|jgi:23S rRNA (adenine2030-N6)-methyltransferase|nr:23S rRNA (adenine(2030)-N(6))-methyltransferase RlmJ [Zoogloeaceae bacterium]
MLSYRHAFHAGNHADVLKHLVLTQMLCHMVQKPAPFWAIDTHAGAGRYSLASEQAQKLGEYRQGIGRLWSLKPAEIPEAVADYLAAVREINPDGALRHYPGSPWLIRRQLRRDDRLRLFELHGNEARLLTENIRESDRQIRIVAEDGLTLLKSLLPPPNRRGLVLIDPSYETSADYAAVLHTLKDALKRFATGTYLLWYPQLAKLESRQLPERLKHLPAAQWLHVSLQVKAPASDGIGMSGSGLFILNPPWTLAETLRQTLPWLTEQLAQDDRATWHLETQET